MIFSERRSSRSISHSSVLDSRDMNEGVSAAVVRLDEAEALGGIEPFYCASGHDEPFQASRWRSAEGSSGSNKAQHHLRG